MRDEFFEWYPLTEAELDEIWRRALIVPDANVLLSFYRWSDKTRDAFLALLEQFSDRLWVPHHAALEYHRSRVGTIRTEIKASGIFIAQVNAQLQALRDPHRHPSVSEPALERLSESWAAVIVDLEEQEKTLESFIAADPVCDRLDALTARRIGPPSSPELTSRVESEGAARFAEKIPPGYMDEKKARSPQQKFGDLVIWWQLIEEAARTQKPVIFITDDRKEDWWRIEDGQKLGARPELIAEFRKATGQLLVFYSPSTFSERAGEHTGAAMDSQSVDEMRALEQPFVDEVLICQDCNSEFAFDATWQQFYADRGWTNYPRRCHNCAKRRKAEILDTPSVSSRPMYPITCTECGQAGAVPFLPTAGKPVICRSCYTVIQDRARGGYTTDDADT